MSRTIEQRAQRAAERAAKKAVLGGVIAREFAFTPKQFQARNEAVENARQLQTAVRDVNERGIRRTYERDRNRAWMHDQLEGTNFYLNRHRDYANADPVTDGTIDGRKISGHEAEKMHNVYREAVELVEGTERYIRHRRRNRKNQ